MPRNDLSRLRAHKENKAARAIEVFARNKPWLDKLLEHNVQLDYPGVMMMNYSTRTHCLTIRYIGLSVQWYVHTNDMYVQNGNAPVKRTTIEPQQLHMRLLHQGRQGFVS